MSDDKNRVVEPLRKPTKCASCGRLSDRKFYPFCSKRCQDIDLHHWFSGSYFLSSNEPMEGHQES